MSDPVPGTWRIFAPALVVWACAAYMVGVPGAARWVMGAVCASAGVLVVAGLHGRSRQTATLIAKVTIVTGAMLILVASRVDAGEWAREDPHLQTAGAVELEVRLSGFVNALEQDGDERYWVLAKAEVHRGSVSFIMWGEGVAPEHWAPGQRLTVTGTLREQAASDASAYALTIREVHEHRVTTYHRIIAELREHLNESAKNTRGAALVPGFAVGDTSLVSDDLDTAMKASSLTHLVAVSGANCALIVTAVMWVVSWLRVGKRARIVAAAGVLGAFVVLVGPDASIQRAAIMAAVTLIAGYGGFRAVAFASLGVAMLVLLIADPWQARQPGFTLSVAATAGILLIATPVDRWLRVRLRVPAWLSLPFAVTFAAQVACGPLLLLLQPGLPVGGVIANMLATPAAPLGTGLGLLALIVLPVHAEIGAGLTVLASLPARWVEWLAFTTETMPLSRLHWPEGATGAIMLTVAQLAIIAAVLLRRTRRRDPWRTWNPMPLAARFGLWITAALGAGMLVAVTIATPVAQRAITPHDWTVAMCDVGQGDAVLIRDPDDRDRVMLTDTGDDRTLLRTCLDRFDVREVTLLVLSHDDQDHVGALDEVLDETRMAIISRPVSGDTEPRAVKQQLDLAGVPSAEGRAGMQGTLGRGSRVHWEILAPTATEHIRDTNPASIVMRVTVGDTRVLMLGDTGRAEHERLLVRGVDLQADIVKVAHHGSRDQDTRLLWATGAHLGLVSSGADNRYGHPSSEVLTDLLEANIVALRTDESGSIAVSLTGGELRVWGER